MVVMIEMTGSAIGLEVATSSMGEQADEADGRAACFRSDDFWQVHANRLALHSLRLCCSIGDLYWQLCHCRERPFRLRRFWASSQAGTKRPAERSAFSFLAQLGS